MNTPSARQNAAVAPTERSVVELTAAQVPDGGAVFCPNPAMPIWNHHPRVFIDLTHSGEGACPYCGTRYRLRAGERLSGH